MGQKRSIRNRGRREKIKALDLDITSLLDILVILLVFLLKNYNASGLTFNIPKSVTLPKSLSQSINTSGVKIKVSPTTIWVEDKVVLDIKNLPPRSYDHGGKRIIPLYNELVSKKELVKRVEKTANGAKKFSGIVNLIVDKSIKYRYIKKLLYTAAEAGYKEYKFVVLSSSE